MEGRLNQELVDEYLREHDFDLGWLRHNFGIDTVRYNGRTALRYPTPVDINRIKFLGPRQGDEPKYTWAEKGGSAHWYGGEWLRLLRDGATTVYIVNGEPSVWKAAQWGVPALCLCVGEGAHREAERLAPEFFSQLAKVGHPVTVRVAYDCDEVGRNGALAVAKAIRLGAREAAL